MAKIGEKKWYPLRVTYRREMKVKYELDALHIENFIPMTCEYKMRGERRVKYLKPAIHNIIFAYTTEKILNEYINSSSYPIRYFTNRDNNKIINVPDNQMRNFIGIAGTLDEQIIYLNPNPANWKRGQRVRIKGGVFSGYEGEFIRIKGDRRIVVEIPGIIAIATGFIHPSLIEPIDER